MVDLLVKPTGVTGKVQDVTPATAGWQYVGFGVYRLAPGDAAGEWSDDREVLLVLVAGRAIIRVGGESLGELGERLDIFDRVKPWSVYLPNETEWSVEAKTACTLAVCHAPGAGNHPVRVIEPGDIEVVGRGRGANQRVIHPILMDDRPWADSLLVTEVYTPQGNWSSYPPHRHDTDDYPSMTYLEETYYHRLNPRQGFGLQRVYTEDGSLDECIAFHDGDVVLVPRGHHPVGAPYGYELYYLNVMAGPRRQWRFRNDPSHEWIHERDSGT